MLEDDITRIESVALQVAKYHIQQRFALFPSFRRNFDVIALTDRMTTDVILGFCFKALSGEIADETKRVEYEYRFQVFESWKDHLWYDIRQGRCLSWLPARMRRMVPEPKYRTEVRKKSEDVPVKVTRMCPHADVEFDRDIHHIEFLKPTSFRLCPL